MTAPTHIDAGYSAVDEHLVFGLKARFMHIAVRNQIAATSEDRSVKSVDFFGKERSYGVKTDAVLKHGSVQCEGDIGRKQNRLQFFAIGGKVGNPAPPTPEFPYKTRPACCAEAPSA
jgi:hypothetical protein